MLLFKFKSNLLFTPKYSYIRRHPIFRRSKTYYFYNTQNSNNSKSDKDDRSNTTGTHIIDTINEINNDNYLTDEISDKNGKSNSTRLYYQDDNNNNPNTKGTNDDDNNIENNKAKTGSNKEDPDIYIARKSSLLKPEEMIRMESFFDSHKVYQEFIESGFNSEQSILLMNFTYYILEQKLTWLHTTFSPEVDLENETYLFQAAQSELLVEITNSREISLMNLTNAMIIIKRAFNNLEDETSAHIKLNDDLIKMELNQFKHENNLHQRSLNLKNSDLNSRIISDMVSGLKSDIESFRWQLTRAGIFAIMIMAASILGVWSFAKKIEFGPKDDDDDNKLPDLIPLHESTDEESHDYEADWDERVNVQVPKR